MSLKNIGIVGATGAVGLEIVRLLKDRNFPLKTIRCFASARSANKVVCFGESEILVEPLSDNSFDGLDLVFFSAGAKVSKEYAPLAKAKGVVVIDNSSAFRQQEEVPLVIPEVNPEDLKNHNFLIANPNCVTILMLTALFPLHSIAKLKRIVVSTYQSASGAGLTAMEDLKEETLAHLQNKTYTRKVVPHPYAFNLFLHNSPMHDNRYLEEELKILHETRKILKDDSIKISATCVRVPVLRSHSESINAEFHFPISKQQAYSALEKAPGIELLENHLENRFAMPIDATGKEAVFCGRIREDLSQLNTLDLWIVGDQLLKGAALNAVQIAELLLESP